MGAIYSHCRVINLESNEGISAVRNHGIHSARGKYIWFVDGDDMLYPNSADRLFAIASRYNADKCFGDYYETSCPENMTTHAMQTTEEPIIHYGKNFVLPSVNQYGAIAASVWCGLWKKSFLLNNHLFFNEDVRYCEDILFNFLSEQCDIMFVKVDALCYVYRVNPTSLSHQHSQVTAIRNFKACKVKLLCFRSFMGKDNSIKLKRIIDNHREALFKSLMQIDDFAFVKDNLHELENILLTKPLYRPPNPLWHKKISDWLRRLFFSNIDIYAHFYISYFCYKLFRKLKH